MKVLLLDTYAYFYRSYYAFVNNPLTNSKGEPTAVIYSFVNLIQKIITERQPDIICCAIDGKEKTFRHEIYKEYKANRKPMPDDLKEQINCCIELIPLLGVPMSMVTHYEADDIMASYAVLASSQNHQVEIFSPDKDLTQVIDQNISVVNTDRKNNQYNVIDKTEFKIKYEIESEQMIDYLALVGDSSDNVPGVAGIGPKGAAKLLNEYGTLESIYENISNVKVALANKLTKDRDNAFLSKKLVTIDLKVKVEPLEKLSFKTIEGEKLLKIFEDKECNQLIEKFKIAKEQKLTLKELFAGEQKNKESTLKSFTRKEIKTPQELKKLVEKIKQKKQVVFDLETTSLDCFHAEIVAIVFIFEEGKSYYLQLLFKDSKLDEKIYNEYFVLLKSLFEDEQIQKIGHNLKFEYSILKQNNISLKGFFFDTLLIEHLLEPNLTHLNLENVISHYFGVEKKTFKDLLQDRESILNIPTEHLRNYTYEDGEFTFRIFESQQKKIKKISSLWKVYNEIDEPLIKVIATTEMNGIRLDQSHFYSLSALLSEKLAENEQEIYSLAGEKFNINSTKKLQEILFEKMSIPPVKKTKSGYSTDNEVLTKLADKHMIVDSLLQYRKNNKLLNTYVSPLPKMLNEKTKKLHTNYHQAIAATGRLSSTQPNLQNIPVDNIINIRKGFIAEENHHLLSIDYSQVEIRVLAYLSQDKNLLLAYQNDIDIHTQTAAILFDKKNDDISSNERNLAKILNFSVIYGATSYSIAQEFKISNEEAKNFIEKYFDNYSGVKEYFNKVIAECRDNFFVETFYGRRRQVDNIRSDNFFLKARAERMAFNSVIQGTAADIIKMAMINIQKIIIEKNLPIQILMQVHDELVFQVPIRELEEIKKLLEEKMIDVKPFEKILKVNSTSNIHWGKS